jgi:hypothetical protein
MFRENVVKTALDIRKPEAGNNSRQVQLLKDIITNGKERDLTNLNQGYGIPLSCD